MAVSVINVALPRRHDGGTEFEWDRWKAKSGVRGKYAAAYLEGTNVVLIDPDLHSLFPDSESVNRALRDYVAMKHKVP